MSAADSSLLDHLKLDPATASALQSFARRRRWLIGLRCAAIAVLAFFGTLIVVALADHLWLLPDSLRMTLSLAAYATTVGVLWFFGLRHLRHQDPQELARQLESTAPRVRDDLLSAVELADPRFANGSVELQNRLQNSVGRRLQKVDISGLLPIAMIRKWLIAGSVVLAICVLLALIPSLQFGRRMARAMLPMASIQRASDIKITIVEPTPATRNVAEGDAVAVVVEVVWPHSTSESPANVNDRQRDTEEVIIQWMVQGETFESTMLSRAPLLNPNSVDSSTTSDAMGPPEAAVSVFAANLSIKTTPVQYRVLAGDAVTLWHTLTPLPRPRVVSFEKRYEFPKYSQLAELTETSDHGDLTALAGTTAHLTIQFDQPVRDATLRYGTRGVALPLQPRENDPTSFTVSLPIKTAGNYQVDAIGIDSELNNPFSPQYTIVPIPDTPPVVRWSEGTRTNMLASPLDVLSLSASIEDDVPVDDIFLEFQVNASIPDQFSIAVDSPQTKSAPAWDWDLMHRNNSPAQSTTLASSDIIHMRVVAVDRKGQRGESRLIEVLIVDEGFTQSRQDHLTRLSDVVSETVDWTSDAYSLIDQYREWLPDKDASGLDQSKLQDLQNDASLLSDAAEPLIQRIMTVLPLCDDPVEAAGLEQIGLAVIDLESKIELIVTPHGEESAILEGDKSFDRDVVKRLDNRLASTRNEVSRVEEFARSFLAHHMDVGVLTDAAALLRSVQPIADPNASVPIELYERYVNVAIARMKTIDALIATHSDLIPESHHRHLRKWNEFSSSWQFRHRSTIDDPPGHANLRSLMQRYASELSSQVTSNVIDQQLEGRLKNLLSELNAQRRKPHDILRQANKDGEQVESLSKKLDEIDDANEAAELNRQLKQSESAYDAAMADLTARIELEESLHRARPIVDLSYASDINLFARAVKNVSADGYRDYREEAISEVYETVSKAFSVISAAHQVSTLQTELTALQLAENRLDQYAEARLEHPLWIERFMYEMEKTVHSLRSAGVPSTVTDAIDQSRYGGAIHQAAERIRPRRWEEESLVSASAFLRTATSKLDAAVQPLTPLVDEARQVILRYVPTLAEQARLAATKAAEAEQRTQQREDASSETAKQLDKQQETAEQAATETLQRLADHANNADMTDASQRELAQDADAAAAQIADSLKRAQQQMDAATSTPAAKPRDALLQDAADSLKDLKEALEQTAEHFERADAGEDVSQSREELRQAESELQQTADLQQQFDQAEAMANAANQSPEELMRQLEQELRRNELMQDELSDIAANAAETAAASLDQAAQAEREINKSLERSDPKIQEQKQRMRQELNEVAEKIDTVRDAMLYQAERAANLGQQQDLKKEITERRAQLQEAAQAVRDSSNGEALMSEVNQVADQAKAAMQSASEAMQQLKQQADAAASESITQSEKQRQSLEQNANHLQRESRNRRSQNAENERKRWDNFERAADSRITQAQREAKSAERQKSDIEKRLKQKPDETWRQQELERAEERIQLAKTAEAAARESKQFAKDKKNAAEKTRKEAQSEKTESLDKANPGAQLAAEMAAKAKSELAQIEKALDEIAKQSGTPESLRAAKQAAEHAIANQSAITKQTETAAAFLDRAARHEERLGKDSVAEKLSEAANSVKENAVASSEAAQQSLAQARDDQTKSVQANQQVAEATEKIQAEADQLSELLAQAMPDDSSAQTSPPSNASPPQSLPESATSENQSPAPQSPAAQSPAAPAPAANTPTARARQLAQTLDDLDQALADSSGQNAGEGLGTPAGESQPEQGQAGDQGKSEESAQAASPSKPGQQQGQTAGQASPTLAAAMQQQAQRMAKQRQSQVNAAQQGNPAESSSQSMAQSSTSTISTSSSEGIADSESIDAKQENRKGSQWGQLRERRTDDANETESNLGALEYQQQIEAYFQAVARRAAEQP
ncbi:membrane protein [Rhodopirellula maiorica SM1]|uniref:Membrane protein n=1 Tax=Rhodopirellula maiorica SM1 TaxID=1265738 RepID=M5S5P9_9BACT|nr:membrane protein [Rhodopirellula maiorica]EMI21524.1 membrane protein [Rhodopirellula maiorica SM1]